jgi:hypothetical protein
MPESFSSTDISDGGRRSIRASLHAYARSFSLFLLLLACVVSTGFGTSLDRSASDHQPADTPSIKVSSAQNAAIAEESIRTALTKTNADLAELKRRVDKPPKDLWDKLSAIPGLVSGAMIGLIGIYATQAFNRRQLAVRNLQKSRELNLLLTAYPLQQISDDISDGE